MTTECAVFTLTKKFCNCLILIIRLKITLIIIIIIIYSLEFFTGVWVTASVLVSPGHFSVTVLINAVVWIVSTRPLTSKSSSSFNNPLVTVPKAPITIGIIVTSMFHIFLILQQGRGTYSSFHILSVLFCGQPRQQNRQFCKFSFFCWLLLGLVFWPRLGDPCVCQSPIGVYVCHFLGQVLGCAYTICLYGQI